MKAIKTQFFGAGNVRGSRIIASAEPHKHNRLIMPYDHALDSIDNHEEAARLLCGKMNWKGELRSGCLDAGIYVHVFI